MKYTATEIKNMVKDASSIETYKYTDCTHRLHTDCIKYIGNSCFNESEIDNLPYDEDGNVDVDVEIMNGERYNETILANCSGVFTDFNEEDDKVAVIVVRN